MRHDPRPTLRPGDERPDPWRPYRAWFWAAALYNTVWGVTAVLDPVLLLRAYGLSPSADAAAGHLPAIFAACIGMLVGLYGVGYACVALDPRRFWPLAAIGLAGKVLGPLGWAFEHAQGLLHWRSFLLVNITNDLLWWPAFITFLAAIWRQDRRRQE